MSTCKLKSNTHAFEHFDSDGCLLSLVWPLPPTCQRSQRSSVISQVRLVPIVDSSLTWVSVSARTSPQSPLFHKDRHCIRRHKQNKQLYSSLLALCRFVLYLLLHLLHKQTWPKEGHYLGGRQWWKPQQISRYRKQLSSRLSVPQLDILAASPGTDSVQGRDWKEILEP